jgi:tetratricopeptide (TPR) repeat protein
MGPEPGNTDTISSGEQIELTVHEQTAEDQAPETVDDQPASQPTDARDAGSESGPAPAHGNLWRRVGLGSLISVLIISCLLALFNELIVAPHYPSPFTDLGGASGRVTLFPDDEPGQVVYDPNHFPDLRVIVRDPTLTPSLPILQLRALYGNEKTKKRTILDTALWHLNRNEEAKAAPLLEQLLLSSDGLDDEQTAVADTLSQIYYNQGRYQQSLDIYSRYVDKNRVMYQLEASKLRAASCLEKLGLTEQAAGVRAEAERLALFPNDGDLDNFPGQSFRDTDANSALESLYNAARVNAAQGNLATSRKYFEIIKSSGLAKPNSVILLRTTMFAPVLSMLEGNTERAGNEFKEALKVHDELDRIKPTDGSPAPSDYNDWEIVCRSYADYLDRQRDPQQAKVWRRKADIVREILRQKHFRGTWWSKSPVEKSPATKEH